MGTPVTTTFKASPDVTNPISVPGGFEEDLVCAASAGKKRTTGAQTTGVDALEDPMGGASRSVLLDDDSE